MSEIEYTKFRNDPKATIRFISNHYDGYNKVMVQNDATYSNQALPTRDIFDRNPRFTTWFRLREKEDVIDMIESTWESITRYNNYDFIDEEYCAEWTVGLSDGTRPTMFIHVKTWNQSIANKIDQLVKEEE